MISYASTVPSKIHYFVKHSHGSPCRQSTIVQKRRSLDGCVPFSLPYVRIYLQPRSICRTTPIDVSPCTRRWCNSINDAKWRSRHRRHKSSTRPTWCSTRVIVYSLKCGFDVKAPPGIFMRSIEPPFLQRSTTWRNSIGTGYGSILFILTRSQQRVLIFRLNAAFIKIESRQIFLRKCLIWNDWKISDKKTFGKWCEKSLIFNVVFKAADL